MGANNDLTGLHPDPDFERHPGRRVHLPIDAADRGQNV
jgi:hypothetical protein